MDKVEAIKHYIGEIASGGLLLIAMALRNWIKIKTVNLYKKVRPAKVKHCPSGQLQMSRQISDAIAELKGRINADRVMVYQFHNGDMFIAKNPMWKMSCTYETTKAGVTSEASNSQNQLISPYMPELASLWTDTWSEWKKTKTTPRGITQSQCRKGCTTQFLGCKVVVLDVDNLISSGAKAMLQNRGTKTTLISPLIINDIMVGFLSADYTTAEHKITEEEHKEVCEATGAICFYIQQGVGK